MRRVFPSLQESIWWVWGGVLYTCISVVFFIEPLREWLYSLSTKVRLVELLSPIAWGWIVATLFPRHLQDVIAWVLAPIFGGLLGYFLRMFVKIVYR